MSAVLIRSIRILLDGEHFLTIVDGDTFELEFAQHFIPADDPDYEALDNRTIFFFRVNGKTVAVTRHYERHMSDSQEGVAVINLKSDDLLRDHIALDS